MQQKDKKRPEQVFYNNKWVNKEDFCAFVYRGSDQKLAKSYKEYEELISSGLWSDERREKPIPLAKSKARKLKNAANG